MRNIVYSCLVGVFIAAEASAGSPGWFDAGKVTRLHTGHGDGSFLFSTEVNIAVSGCPATTLGYLVKDTASNGNRIYSTLMAAYMAQKPVSIYVTGQCIIERPEVGAIQIKEVPYY
jgi:hypothetical protein